MRRALAAIVTALLLVGAGCVSAPPPAGTDGTTQGPTATPQEPPTLDPTPTDDPPPDPETDRLGWEDGYWHNETLDVEAADGLTRSELDAVVSRAKARVEAIRGLEFDRNVSVRVVDRSSFRNETTGGDPPTANRSLHQDVKFEALFFLGETESAIGQQEENRASGVLGYYSPGNHSITIVSEGDSPLEMNEVTLAQELFHAVQNSYFDISGPKTPTEEGRNAFLGIVEGDGNYVDYLYERRYGEDLVMPQTGSGGGGGGDRHVGLFALRYQAYSDGPPFVAGIRESSGWAGVNDVYDDLPASSEQTIHPERYGVDQPVNVTIADRSSETWAVPDQGDGHIDYAQFGEAGLYAMFWYPSYAATAETGSVTDVVIPYRHFFDAEGPLDAYNYSHPVSDGWEGDRLLPYVREDSEETNETGYVWRIEWESSGEARAFVAAYEDLLVHHGATAVEDGEQTYRIQEGPFADAFAVERNGSTVTIVNAPTVAELDAVHAGAP